MKQNRLLQSIRFAFVANIFLVALGLACGQETDTDSTKPIDSHTKDPGNDGQHLNVMSFNIRYGLANDGNNSWPYRSGFVTDVIQEFAPDLLGIQEAMGFQAKFLKLQLPEFQHFGASRDANPNGEQCGIFVRTSRFDILTDGQFWLSETPDKKYSKSWDASLTRIATWVQLKDKNTKRQLLFLNTHFDHRGAESRIQAAAIIRKFIDKQTQVQSVIVTGDFNCSVGSKPHQTLLVNNRLQDTWQKFGKVPSAHEGTFHGFQGNDTGARIDWVLCSRELKVIEANIVKTSKAGKYPSDHFPVTAVLK